MNVVWPDDCAVIDRFVNEVMAGFVAIVTTNRGATYNLLVGGTGRPAEGDLLHLFGQQLDDDFNLVQPRQHVWIEWDHIATLEVH